jgi:hypothetical protein
MPIRCRVHYYPPVNGSGLEGFVRFTVLAAKASVPEGAGVAFLERNGWDDFGYKLLFELYYRDADGTIHYVGAVKIGSFDLGRAGQPDVVPLEY